MSEFDIKRGFMTLPLPEPHDEPPRFGFDPIPEFIPEEIDMPDSEDIDPRLSDAHIRETYERVNKLRRRHGLPPLIPPATTCKTCGKEYRYDWVDHIQDCIPRKGKRWRPWRRQQSESGQRKGMMGSRRFVLERLEDPTGISGTGHIAEGVEFSDGFVVLRWMTEWRSTGVYEQGIKAIETIHGHGGATRVVWLDEKKS